MLGKQLLSLKKMYFDNLTFIIPAAGRSTRFKFKESKIFYKFKKKTLIEHIINKVKKFTKNIIIVSNLKNYKKLKLIIKKYKFLNIIIILQKIPRGMGDAVKIGLSKVNTEDAGVVWADQIFLTQTTIKKTVNYYYKFLPALCFPIFLKKNPYVYVNFKNKKFIQMIQTKEGGQKVKRGYSDCGFFLFKKKIMLSLLKHLINRKEIIAKKTKEIDFLKSFYFLNKDYKILTPRANSIQDTKGINFLEDFK